MHFCSFNKILLGLGYDYYNPTILTYGVFTFELYQCSKCKKLFYVNQIFISEQDKEIFEDKVSKLISIGYKPIGELIN